MSIFDEENSVNTKRRTYPQKSNFWKSKEAHYPDPTSLQNPFKQQAGKTGSGFWNKNGSLRV